MILVFTLCLNLFLNLLFKSKRQDYYILKFKRGMELQIKEIGKGLRGDISYGIDQYTCISFGGNALLDFFVSPVLSALLPILYLFHFQFWKVIIIWNWNLSILEETANILTVFFSSKLISFNFVQYLNLSF